MVIQIYQALDKRYNLLLFKKMLCVFYFFYLFVPLAELGKHLNNVHGIFA
jgi:hypothetical protein